ncbi:hypothetical protein MASR2M78_24310 [Treponema sp.]
MAGFYHTWQNSIKGIDSISQLADTQRMQQLFEVILITLLTLIAFILYLVYRELTQLRRFNPGLIAEDRKAAQSITVNVGSTAEKSSIVPVEAVSAIPATSQITTAPEIDEDTRMAMEKARSTDRKIEAKTPERPVASTARPTESGLLAKKCPSCQAENSTYRSECFNCGSNL